MADTASVIYRFLIGKGLSPAQAAGVMGNLQVESSFNPSALNEHEGAIGIAQWEGGRRAALQQWAASHGTNETDLNAQLGYLWHELTTTEAGALQALRGARDAGSAATAWDQYFERSSGSTRSERVQNAESIFGSGGHATGVSTSSAGVTQLAGGDGLSGLAAQPSLTAGQYEQALGTLAGVIKSVPELKKALDKAIKNQSPVEDFVNDVQNSAWYKTHNDTYKKFFALKISNPTEYKSQINQVQRTILNTASQMGVKLSSSAAYNMATKALYQQWDSQTLQNNVGKLFNVYGKDTPAGQAAQTYQQLQQLYSAYGVPVGDATLRYRTEQILSGATTIDTYKAGAVQSAKSLYPGLSSQLDSGQTTQDIAQPYISTMAQTLELPETSLTLKDPTIQKALQSYTATAGTPGGIGGGGGKKAGQVNGGTADDGTAPGVMPLWQFQKNLRQDPRWGQTTNAKQEAYGMLHDLGKAFGFAS